MSIVSGKLKFKGNFQTKLEKEEKKYKKKSPTVSIEKEILTEKKSKEPILVEFSPEPGTGRLITSGLTVHGKDTKFMSQIKNGDFIVIQDETTFDKEERPVSAVLSDKSMALSTPFSSDVITYKTFEIRKKPEYKEPEDTLEEKYEKKLQNFSKKIKKDVPVLEYREKKGMWGYKLIKEELDDKKEITREDLLDLRSKKSRDKFCWI